MTALGGASLPSKLRTRPSYRALETRAAQPGPPAPPAATTTPVTLGLGASPSVLKLLAGGASSAASRVLLAPLEVIRTVQQAAPPTQAPTLIAVARRLLADEGWRALLKGTRAQLIKSVPEYAVRFGAFDALRDALAVDAAHPTLTERLIAGGCAGVVAQIVVYPLEVVKTRLTLAPAGAYAGVAECACMLVRKEGASSLLRGLGPSLVGVFPFAALEQGVNSFLKDALKERRRAEHKAEPSVLELLACGVVSSSLAAATTYPLHLVRTRVQASGLAGMPQYTDAWQCARCTYQAGGIRNFYTGLSTSLLKGAPSAALGWGIFELLCAQIDTRLCALNALIWLVAIVSSTLFARARWRLVMAGRARLLRAVLESEGGALGGRSAGELVGRLERDTEKLVDVSLHGAERLLAGAGASLVSLCAMVRIEPRLALLGVLLRSPLTLALTRLAAERVGLYGAVQAEALGSLDKASSELISQLTTVQLHGIVDQEVARAEALGREVVSVVDHTVDAETALRFSKLLLEGLQEVATAAVGLTAVRAGRLSAGQYIAFLGFLGLWERGYEQFLSVWARLAELRASMAPYFALLDAQRAVALGGRAAAAGAAGTAGAGAGGRGGRGEAPAAAKEQPAACAGAVSVRQLRFSYPKRAPQGGAGAGERGASGTGNEQPAGGGEALRGVDLEIAAGSSVAIVGASGSGKSSLALAIARLLQPTAGSVALDGTSLALLDTRWLREHVAVVAQDARLFDRSLLENIRLHANATDAQVLEVAAAVGVDEIAASLAGGMNTSCGEGGCRLSGGQRQRVLLARALLRRPRVLVLDEATSQLDACSELAMLRAIEQHLAETNATLITVTHSLAAARRARRLIVMELGKVVGDGTHEELLADGAQRCEAYARLIEAGMEK